MSYGTTTELHGDAEQIDLYDRVDRILFVERFFKDSLK